MRGFLCVGMIAAAACGNDGREEAPDAERGGTSGSGAASGRAGSAPSSAGRAGSASAGNGGRPATSGGTSGATAGTSAQTGGTSTQTGGTSASGSGHGGAPASGAAGASGGEETGGSAGEAPVGEGGAPSLEDETIGSYADFDLENHAVYTVDLGHEDYPLFLTEGATHTFEPEGGWNGGPAARITPPLNGGYGGIGAFGDLWRGGSFTIRKLNFRFEVQFGAEFGTHWPNDDLKFIIVHSADTLGGETNERPMCNWANASDAGSGLLAWAVGAGTVKNFNRSPPFEPAYSPSGDEDFYLGPSAGTFNDHPVVGPESWISIEVEIVSEATAEHPNGLIRSVLTLRNGTELTNLSIPWTYDSNWSLSRYLSEVQIIGGYYNTGSTGADPDNFYRIANHVTFAANRSGLLGPRAGFVMR